MTDLHAERLRCEHLCNPLGVDASTPRLSWQVSADRRGTVQAAYRVLVASSPALLAAGTGDRWDSGRVTSPDCVLVPYAGRPLQSRERAYWTVRVWDELAEESEFAPAAWWEMGLLDPSDWEAQWIAARAQPAASSASYLRSRLVVDGPVVRARAYATALGLYELRCNGQRVGDSRFTPGWTDYRKRLQYQVHDLTDLLHLGENTLEAVLVDGWYAGYVGFQEQREHYGDTPQLLVQVEVETPAGRAVHSSGAGWLVGEGPLRLSDMLKGETWDLRAAVGSHRPVRVTAGTPARRVLSPAPPVRVLMERSPISVTRVDEDVHRVDLGQNLVGWLRLRLRGEVGSTVQVRHAEVVGDDGALHLANLRSATALDSYVLTGGVDVCEPAFTFHGFRYAEITGYPGELTAEDITGVVCGSDLEPVGEFECDHPGVNQLYSNIVWGARGNFLDIPTDCPQRDERMGWTGDAQVFAPTAGYLFDTAAFFTKWLRDVVDTQTPEGSFCDVAPAVVLGPEGSAGWADAGVIVPWAVSQRYGDDRLLAECYPAMRRWVSYVHAHNPDLLWLHARGYDNGDWLNVGVETDKDLIATAFFARSARLTAHAAHRLGRTEEEAQLHALADGITEAFRSAYLMSDGRLTSETQTAYALALRFGLVPDGLRLAAVDHLVADIAAHGGRITAGFLGAGQLLPALTDGGRNDVAYQLLLNEGFPSWLYAVNAGATTIWERWDGWTAEQGFHEPAMNSYNHYAFGAVGEWLLRTAAGIDVGAGGRHVTVAPAPHPSLGSVRARHRTAVGEVTTSWRLTSQGGIELDLTVPVGATARVVHPAGAGFTEVGSGTYHFDVNGNVRS